METKIKEKLTGVFVPVATPFVNQKIDYDKLRANIEKMNESKVKGYMLLGSNGEFMSLTDDEALKVVEIINKAKAQNKTLIVGAGRESAFATIEFIKKVSDRGADFASIITPHYFADKMTDETLRRFFVEVADNSPLPILLYCIPKYSAGVVISSECVAKMAYHDNIFGMKDSSKLDIADYIKAVPHDTEFYILAGSITKFLTGLQGGAIGGILSMANYLPNECCKIQELDTAGNYEEAKELSERLCEINKNISGKYGVAGVKTAMDLLGYYGCEPRIPLMPLSNNEKNNIKDILISYGLELS
jgi:4-hydroxy-2-oxoglutarate aldolase